MRNAGHTAETPSWSGPTAETQRSRGRRGPRRADGQPEEAAGTLARKPHGARLMYQVGQRRHSVAQAATQAARSLVHWAKREKRETTPRRGQPHRAEKKQNKRHRPKGPCVGVEGASFSKLVEKRERRSAANPPTTAESQLEARPRRPHSAGRPGYAAERPKRRRRWGRRGRAA